jgi:hypothetical protein
MPGGKLLTHSMNNEIDKEERKNRSLFIDFIVCDRQNKHAREIYKTTMFFTTALHSKANHHGFGWCFPIDTIGHHFV